MRIAILDDDPLLLDLLQAMTESLGHVCHTFGTGAALLKTLRRDSFDLLIVDWHLPDMDGPEVVRAARALTGSQIPILFVTRRQAEQDIVEALASGADDFMTKPVRIGEFSARINALRRRAYPDQSADALSFGRYRFDAPTRSLHLDGAALELTELEYALALFMFQNSGRLLSREHLREMVWGQTHEVTSRTIDTHISRLRSKLKLGTEYGYTVTAVYGTGYRLEVVAEMVEPATAPGAAATPLQS